VPVPPQNRSSTEIGFLYATGVGYGIGMGIWLDAEIGVTDPAAGLIAPAVLGLAAPVGVYLLDDPAMPRGMPAAIAAGMTIGAGEGLGIAGLQFVTAKESDAWGFRGLTRSVALGATLGGAAGWAVGYYAEPSPKLSAFVTSGAFWGTMIGSSIGYGVSKEGIGYGRANDDAAVAGLIGFNAGLAATAGLSMLFVPTWTQVGWMWAGGAIGGAASLPVFLFYAGKDAPPAKRGLVFTGTAIGLGIIAGGIFSSGELTSRSGGRSEPTSSTGIAYVVPTPMKGGAGLQLGGTWE
jgi:hypothetical protein